jgi:hypothetical protein
MLRLHAVGPAVEAKIGSNGSPRRLRREAWLLYLEEVADLDNADDPDFVDEVVRESLQSV